MLWTLYEHKSEPDGTYRDGAGQDECRPNYRYFTVPTGIEFEAVDVEAAEFHVWANSFELDLEGKEYTLRLVTQSPTRKLKVRWSSWLEQAVKAAPVLTGDTERFIELKLPMAPLTLYLSMKEATFLDAKGKVVATAPISDTFVRFSTRHHVEFMKGDMKTAVPNPLPDESLYIRLPKGLTEDQGDLFAGA
jgi:hypothetical protein